MLLGKSEELRQWTRTVIEKMPHLSKSQALILAMWSFGIVMTQSCGLTTVSVFLAELLGKKENTVRQQLREWLRDGEDKTKAKTGRATLDVTLCFSALLSWILINTLVWEVGQSFSGLVTCFKTNSVKCTLLARHDEGYADPWLILTDLPPEIADACWYTMRCWIECLFKDGKRGGFGWHRTKITHPKRAERHWLAMAVATLWQVSVGGEVDANLPISSLDELPPTHVARRNFKHSVVHRCLSCFRRGFLVIKAAVLNREPLPIGSFFPQPWPNLTPQLHVLKITLSTA